MTDGTKIQEMPGSPRFDRDQKTLKWGQQEKAEVGQWERTEECIAAGRDLRQEAEAILPAKSSTRTSHSFYSSVHLPFAFLWNFLQIRTPVFTYVFSTVPSVGLDKLLKKQLDELHF